MCGREDLNLLAALNLGAVRLGNERFNFNIRSITNLQTSVPVRTKLPSDTERCATT